MTRLLAVAALLLVIGLVVVAVRAQRTGEDAVALAAPTTPTPVPGPTAGQTTASPTPAPPTQAGATGTDAGAPTTPEAADAQPPEAPAPTPTGPPIASAIANPIANEGPHPDLRDIDGWLQSDVSSLKELRGKVVVVEFWTFGCINCQRTLPNLIELYGAHSRDDLEFVGIHSPEFAHEADVDNIVAAAADLGVTWPIALDTNKRTFHHWQEGTTAYWPRTYVLDRDGNIRFDHIGEGRYDELNETVARLIADPAL